MKIDVAMELSKNEIVNNINEVSKRYNLPSCLLNNIIQSIVIEVNNIAQQDLAKNMEEYKREENMELYKNVKKKEKESE
jgi:hypothetical protein